MNYGDEYAAIAVMMVFYFVFLGLWWLVCGIIGHALLNKKGYRHVGLYVMAWVPLLNWISIFLFVGLPDALLNRKVDYLLRQLAANGMIQGPPQPAYPQPAAQAGPQPGVQPGSQAEGQFTQSTQFGAQAAPQAASQSNEQPVWQPPQQQAQQAQAPQQFPQSQGPISPENLFGPGTGSNNNNSNS